MHILLTIARFTYQLDHIFLNGYGSIGFTSTIQAKYGTEEEFVVHTITRIARLWRQPSRGDWVRPYCVLAVPARCIPNIELSFFFMCGTLRIARLWRQPDRGGRVRYGAGRGARSHHSRTNQTVSPWPGTVVLQPSQNFICVMLSVHTSARFLHPSDRFAVPT